MRAIMNVRFWPKADIHDHGATGTKSGRILREKVLSYARKSTANMRREFSQLRLVANLLAGS